MENKEAEQYLRRSSVRNNCEKGAMRFNGNFELWIIDREKRMPKLKFRQGLQIGLVSLIAFFSSRRLFEEYGALKVDFFQQKLNKLDFPQTHKRTYLSLIAHSFEAPVQDQYKQTMINKHSNKHN